MADHVTIGELIPQGEGKNARKHTPRNIGMIAASLQEVGAARSIVIDENNEILAGNGTWEAAGQVGIERVRVVEADGNELIAVRRIGLTDDQKKRLALADNRTAELAEWDLEVLQELNDQDGILEGLFYENEIDRMLGLLEPVDPAELWKGMPEFEQDALSDKYKSLIVHFETPDDYEQFARLINQALTPKSNFSWYPYKPTHGIAGSMQGYKAVGES